MTGAARTPVGRYRRYRRSDTQSSLLTGDWLQQYDGNHAAAGSLLVGVIAVVVVVHALPKLAAFGLVDHPWADSDVLAPELDRYGVGVGAEVVLPGGVMGRTGL
jgi:hypothetical protein